MMTEENIYLTAKFTFDISKRDKKYATTPI